MENIQKQHQSTNNFFYKFYNYNLEDRALLELIPNELYGHVTRELASFKDNTHIVNMDAMQYSSFLFNRIKLNYPTLHEMLVNGIKKLYDIK